MIAKCGMGYGAMGIDCEILKSSQEATFYVDFLKKERVSSLRKTLGAEQLYSLLLF